MYEGIVIVLALGVLLLLTLSPERKEDWALWRKFRNGR